MFYKKFCPECGIEIHFKEKDVIPLNDADVEIQNKHNSVVDDIAMETVGFWIFKRKKFSDASLNIERMERFGKIKCICGETFYLEKRKVYI